MLVYKVTFPNNKVYIGITSKTLEFRKKKHYSECFNRNTNYKIHNALRKYKGKENWEQIDTSECWESLCSLEQLYIEAYDSKCNGYNSTLGGDGIYGHVMTEDSRNKMRGLRPQTSKALKGKSKSEAHKKALSISRTGFKYSKEQKLKIAIKAGSKKFQVFRDGTLVGTWVNKKQCARDLSLHERGIQGCLNQPTKFLTHKNCTFKYVNEGEYCVKV